RKLIHGAGLNTICEEARCLNIAECWGRGTATFQILGETCTRACRYCYVNSGKPEAPPAPPPPQPPGDPPRPPSRYCYVNSGKPEAPPAPLEPLRLAQVAKQME